jgi:hypothetical protein
MQIGHQKERKRDLNDRKLDRFRQKHENLTELFAFINFNVPLH